MSMNYAQKIFAYIVQPDDTFWDLAERYDTSVEMIFAVNPGVDADSLIAGQVIALPGDPPSARPEFDRRRAELERRRRRELERRRRTEQERRRKEERRRRAEFGRRRKRF
jgi:LysM repeat protein